MPRTVTLKRARGTSQRRSQTSRHWLRALAAASKNACGRPKRTGGKTPIKSIRVFPVEAPIHPDPGDLPSQNQQALRPRSPSLVLRPKILVAKGRNK